MIKKIIPPTLKEADSQMNIFN